MRLLPVSRLMTAAISTLRAAISRATRASRAMRSRYGVRRHPARAARAACTACSTAFASAAWARLATLLFGRDRTARILAPRGAGHRRSGAATAQAWPPWLVPGSARTPRGPRNRCHRSYRSAARPSRRPGVTLAQPAGYARDGSRLRTRRVAAGEWRDVAKKRLDLDRAASGPLDERQGVEAPAVAVDALGEPTLDRRDLAAPQVLVARSDLASIASHSCAAIRQPSA